DCAQPYHPDYLLKHDLYKVLRITDGPLAAYDRDFAYVHAFDHVLYHTVPYSADMDMRIKLRYVGARKTSLWPMGLFDASHDPSATEEEVVGGKRDVDIVFVGAMHLGKMDLIAKVRRA